MHWIKAGGTFYRRGDLAAFREVDDAGEPAAHADAWVMPLVPGMTETPDTASPYLVRLEFDGGRAVTLDAAQSKRFRDAFGAEAFGTFLDLDG